MPVFICICYSLFFPYKSSNSCAQFMPFILPPVLPLLSFYPLSSSKATQRASQSHMAQAKHSLMVDAIPSSTPQYSPFFKAQDILRGLAIVLTAASIAVMVTNSQTVTIFMVQFEAHYYYSSAFKFLVAAEAIVCGFSVLTWIIVRLLLRRQAISQRRHYYFYLFLHDVVMTLLMICGCAAATAIGYVGQYGESHMGWEAICERVAKFCRTNVVSLLLSYLAFFAYLGLTLFTPYYFISSSPNSHN